MYLYQMPILTSHICQQAVINRNNAEQQSMALEGNKSVLQCPLLSQNFASQVHFIKFVSSAVFPELSKFTACIFSGTVISVPLNGFFLGHYFTCMADCKNYRCLYYISLINVYPANHKICIDYKLFIEVTSANAPFYGQKCSHMQHKQFTQ